MANRAERRRKASDSLDRAASGEARAIDRLHALAPRRQDARVTSAIHWQPKQASGTTGWLRLSERRQLRAAFVRNASHRTPKLANTYIRCFAVTIDQ